MRYTIYQLFIYHFEFVTHFLIVLLISVQFYKYVHFYVHFFAKFEIDRVCVQVSYLINSTQNSIILVRIKLQ